MQVLRGLAKDVKHIVDMLSGFDSVAYVHTGQSSGAPKIGLRWGNMQPSDEKHIVRIKVRDPDYGEGDIRIQTLRPAATAYMMRKLMSRDKGLAKYLEPQGN